MIKSCSAENTAGGTRIKKKKTAEEEEVLFLLAVQDPPEPAAAGIRAALAPLFACDPELLDLNGDGEVLPLITT